MRILITGISGFVGGHLTERLLRDANHTILGLSREGQWPQALSHLGQVPIQAAELSDRAKIGSILSDFQPEWVFHLAGYANTGKSFKEPDKCWADNLTATRQFYDAVVESGLKPRILFVSSGLVYGEPDAGHTCDELTTLKPASPYAASKAAADLLGYQYFRTAGLDILRIRMFNQIGPRQPADYAVANFARQIAAIEAGQQPATLTTGNLSAQRDVTDIRDMADAFRRLIEFGRAGEAYNAGQGKPVTIQHLLDRLIHLARLPIRVESKVESGRAGDTTVTCADTRKLKSVTGWQPGYTLDQTLADVLNYWRSLSAQ